MFDPIISKLDKYFWVDLKVKNPMNESHLVSWKILLAVRVIFAIYTTVVVIFQTLKITNIGAFLEFLTFWGALCVQWYFSFSVIEMISYKLNGNRTYYPSIWKFTYMLWEFSFFIQFLIVLVFWGFIVPQLGGLAQFGGLSILLNTQLHGGFFIVLNIETALNNIQFQKRHMIVILGLMVIYAIVNLVYTLSWSPVYPGLNWHNWNTLGVLVIMAVVFTMQYFLALFIYNKWKHPRIMRQKQAILQSDSSI